MANVLLSPGVLSIENDQSFIRQQPITVGAAIVGPTVLGPVEVPTIVTSYSDFRNRFGDLIESGSDTYSYFTSIAAYNYFTNGGQSLLVTRVASGSYTAATSSAVINNISTASNSFVLETLSKGAIMNSTSTTLAGGVLASGSSNNLRWEIVNPVTSSGQFTLLVRQGNDSTNSKSVLETFPNLTLDPFSPNFISKVIGDYEYNFSTTVNQVVVTGSYPNNSRYIRVKQINNLTPNYFDSNGQFKPQYTASIPLAQTGSFGSAVGDIKPGTLFWDKISENNSQGLEAANYTNAITILSNASEYRFNTLIFPGLVDEFTTHNSKIDTIITNTQDRGDNIFVLDLVKYGASIATTVGFSLDRDTSYAASYWPWCQVLDPATGKNVWVPASTLIAGVYAFNDRVSEPWFAPAGINRGGLSTVIRTEFKLSQTNRDTLYQNKVNPIATFPGQGIVVYGQKTLQLKASALDRVNVRRLLIAVKDQISQIANTLIFEQNTAATRNSFLSQVNPYLTSVQQRQGLYAFRVVMDDSLNSPDVIDRNQLIGQIYLQPTKTAEFIYLTFNVTPTGATFE
jgi:hypothetical protein